ncbi:MAG: glycosyltransferase family 4 protein [Pyrinomonadaceae bacterium]|nr:glycosyltransferase family 4 protein [Pyrinomonadaceae bacterium]
MDPSIQNGKSTAIKRVIYAWPYLTWGGAQIYFLGLLKEARKYFDISVVMPAGSDPQLVKYFEEEGIEPDFFEPAFERPVGSGLSSKYELHRSKIASERGLLNHLEEKYDLESSIVHIELAPWQSLLSLVWLSLRTIVFITMHNSLPHVNPIRKALWNLKLRTISRFRHFHPFSSNRDSKNYFKGMYSDEMHKSIAVTYTNVNPEEIDVAYDAQIDREAIRKANGLRADSFLVICVGQFVDRKGRWTFLDAAKRVIAESDDIDFAWVSNSELSSSDASKIEDYDLGDRFKLIDSDSVGNEHSDLFKLVRASDIFVLPSFVEGLPISLLEAMALEMPCISTSINAIPEAVIHEETGLLIEAGDDVDLAGSIMRLRSDEELREALRSAARELVLNTFNEKEVAKIASERYLAAARLKK